MTGGDGHARGASGHDECAGVGHGDTVAERGVLRQLDAVVGNTGTLRGRQDLAGEHRFVDAQSVGRRDPQVSGHHVAGFETDRIAGDQICGRNVGDHAVADDSGLGGGELRQGGDVLLRLACLPVADRGVQHDDKEDDRTLEPFLLDKSDDAGEEQEDHHRGRDLPAEDDVPGVGGGLGELVGTVAFQSGGGVCGGQAGPGVREVESGSDLLDAGGVPDGCGHRRSAPWKVNVGHFPRVGLTRLGRTGPGAGDTPGCERQVA